MSYMESEIIQEVRATDSTVITVSTAIPIDNTIPQNTEGEEVISLSITPTDSSSILRFNVNGWGATHAFALIVVTALFQDSNADALTCSAVNGDSGWACPIQLNYYKTAGTTSSTTFKIRIGGNTANPFSVNGNSSGTRIFGGISSLNFTVQELRV